MIDLFKIAAEVLQCILLFEIIGILVDWKNGGNA